MTWPTKRERRASLVVGLLGILAGSVLPPEAQAKAAVLLDAVLKLFVSW